MRKTLCAILLVGGLSSCQEASPESSDLVLEHVTVVDVTDGTMHADQSVFIDAGRIIAVIATSESSIPSDARAVGAGGRYLIPGLWDAHVHSAANTDWHFPVMIAHGITSVRNLHTTVDDALGLTSSIKRDVSAGDLLGPRFLANGPIIDGAPSAWPGAVEVRDEAQARAAVDSLVDGGADFIKVYDSLTRETFLALMEQAEIRGMPVDGHMPFAVSPEEAAVAGLRTVEHMSGITMGCSTQADSVREAYARLISQPPRPFPEGELAYFGLIRAASDTHDAGSCETTVRAYLDAGVAVVPTLVNQWSQANASVVVADSAAMRLVPVDVRERWTLMAGPGPGEMISAIMGPVHEKSLDRLRLLHAAGVPLLAGTDVGNPFVVPGRSLHDELAALVEAGLSPLEALQTATSNPARILGFADSLGAVSEGYLADLVLLDENPLEDVENVRLIAGVVVAGRYFDRDALDALVARAIETAGDEAP